MHYSLHYRLSQDRVMRISFLTTLRAPRKGMCAIIVFSYRLTYSMVGGSILFVLVSVQRQYAGTQ